MDKRRARLLAVCTSLPELDVSGDPHLAFRVRKKTFAYYLHDHHGDGRIALCCKAAPGEMRRLVDEDPRRFFVPCYLGARKRGVAWRSGGTVWGARPTGTVGFPPPLPR